MNSTNRSIDPAVAHPGLTLLLAGLFRYSAVKLLAALGLLFAATPFMYDWPNGDLVESLLLTLVMVFAVLQVSEQRRSRIIVLLLVVPTLAGKWIHQLQPDLMPPVIYVIGTIFLFGFVVIHILHFIVAAPRVDANVICAGMAGFIMLGMLWIPVYLLVAQTTPDAFSVAGAESAHATLNGFDAFYFSFVTLCTVGYGDIAPVSNGARMLAVLEAITGLFYMAVLISRLVSIHSSGQSAVRVKTARE